MNSSWGALVVDEFSPISVDFYWNSFPKSFREIRALRYRRGWLRISEVKFNHPFGIYKRDLLSCIDHYDQQIEPSLIKNIFDMRANFPYCPFDCAPDELLDKIEDGLYWDFIGEVDQVCLDKLKKMDENGEVFNIQEKYDRYSMLIEDFLRTLRKRRRKVRREPDKYQKISRKIELVESNYNNMSNALRKELQIASVSSEKPINQVNEAILRLPVLKRLYTVRWRIMG